jgi:hypothetical protein
MWASIPASRLDPILSLARLYLDGPKSATARTADRIAGAFGTNPPSMLLERCSDHSASV